MPLLTATDIRKSYAGVRALRGVSFTVEPGEVHALVGENGAGKSTLIRILTGAERPDSGTLAVAGAPVDLAHFNPARARDLGIAVVYQQPALFPDLTVTENIALRLERDHAWRLIDWTRRRAVAADLLARTGAAFDPDCLAGSLSMPEQQLVEIASAIGANARVVLMDEPTASLTDREVARLFEVIQALKARGASVIYISHRLEEVFALADRITVLRDGESVGTGPRGSTTRDEIVRLMAGRELASAFPKRPVVPGAVALEVRGLSSESAAIRDVSLSVRQGEILGIAGLVGSGRTELAEVLFGLRPLDRGDVVVNGRTVTIGGPADAMRLGLAYVPEDRRRHGVIGELSIAANTSLTNLGAVSVRGLVRRTAERTLARRFAGDLRIQAPGVGVLVQTLSGGNQQKVALARWLSRTPSVLILDEPTQGVDVGAKAEIHALVQEMAGRGLAIILISSELPEVIGMSDRIVVMRNGTVAGTFERAEATAEGVLALAVGSSPVGAHA